MHKPQIKFNTKLLLLFSVILLVCACSSKSNEKTKVTTNSNESTPIKGGEAVFAYQQDISNFDPIKGSAGGDHALLWPIYETLISFSADLKAQPGLAESWEYTGDKTLVLKLKDGVIFHDGTKFDAEAVKFNIERTLSKDSKVSDLKNIESVIVIDPLTVKLQLKKADSSILLTLSDRGGMIVSPTAVKKGTLSQNPIGAGPYKFVSRVPNGEIVLVPFKDYWKDGKPYLDKMTIKIMPDENTRINALKSGEVDFAYDITPGNVANLKSNPNLVINGAVSAKFKVIYINASMEPFDNKAVRLAVQHGINREALIKAINFGSGEPANSLFPKGNWAADKDIKVEYDPNKSKQLIREANLKNVSFTLNHYSKAFDTRLAEAIKSQLKEVGIEMKLQPMELNAAVSNYFSEKKVPALLSDWNGRPDPQMTIQGMFSNDSFYNAGGYSTPEIQSLISETSGYYKQEEQVKIYNKITELALLEEGIAIPLYFSPTTAAMSNKIKGFEPNMLGKPIFSTMWIKK